MNASDTGTRRGAAQALRNIGTQDAVKPLVQGLYDSDWEVRWLSTMGLAGIVGPDEDGNSWYPASDGFKEDEQLYLDHWRTWASNQGLN